MGMVVRTNVMAMNANRQLAVNNSSVGKSLEKLSSGFRINRAADDASGLAISEKMKAQIKGLEQASANSQDGISLIQTAEGATTEIHNMLNRMVELATKSANGTIQNDVDRDAIQQEVDDLNAEITRIAQSTNFNGLNLLDGKLSRAGVKGAAGVPSFSSSNPDAAIADVAATKYVNNSAAIATADANAVNDKISYTFNYTDAAGKTQSATVNFTVKTVGTQESSSGAGDGIAGVLIAEDGTEYTETDLVATGFDGADLSDALAKELAKNKDFSKSFSVEDDGGDLKFTAKTAGANSKINSIVINDDGTEKTNTMDATPGTPGADAYQKLTGVKQGDVITIGGKKFSVFENAAAAQAAKDALTGDDVGKYDNVNFVYSSTAGTSDITTTDVVKLAAEVKLKTGYDGLTAGANAGEIAFKAPTKAAGSAATGGLKLQVGDTNDAYNHVTVSVDDLSATGLEIDGLKVDDQVAAGNAIDTIKTAINKVSTNRANLGSLQNRLEHTINNLDTTAENMTAANSRIRDTDMAKEMMNYTKMNILTQSAQAMLAQANQQPQAILQLLQ